MTRAMVSVCSQFGVEYAVEVDGFISRLRFRWGRLDSLFSGEDRNQGRTGETLHSGAKTLLLLYSDSNCKLCRFLPASTKAKTRELAYSQALNKNKINSRVSRSRESDRHVAVRRPWWMMFGVERQRERQGRG